MSRKYRNTEIFKNEIDEMYGNNLVVLGEFKSMKEKIEMYCALHNEKFEKEPDKILNRNQHCKKCGRLRISESKKMSNEEFIEKFYFHRNNEDYSILSEYRGDKSSVLIHHSICNESYNTTPRSIWNSKGCPICNDKRKDENTFIMELNRILGSDYELVSNYINCFSHVNIYHKSCGNVWNVMPNSVIQGHSCNHCRKEKQRKTQHQFEKDVYAKYSGEYEVLGEYKTSQIKVMIKHVKCGYKWEITPSHLLSGCGCPICNKFISKGEVLIQKLLSSNSIPHTKEYIINVSEHDKRLRIDYFINKYLAIEYDGRQHFEPIAYFAGEEKYDIAVINDNIKNQYCIDNNIPLIRIPYTQQKNIEYILHNVLIHFGLIKNEQDTYDKEIVLKYLVDSNWDHDNYIKENTK